MCRGGAPSRHAPRERVSWNFIVLMLSCIFWVTLHVSVWVEIICGKIGMKRSDGHAPRERVSWNTFHKSITNSPYRHAPRERVSWNLTNLRFFFHKKSHAPRERVSWNLQVSIIDTDGNGHAPRERVSWNSSEPLLYVPQRRHAPRERVSWNWNLFLRTQTMNVTLHVSVWVNFRFNAGLRVYVIRSDHSKCCVVFKACSKRRLSWI